MSNRSITNRRLPDIRQTRTDTPVRGLVVALFAVLMLPGCLAYHLHEDNPVTISMGSEVDRSHGSEPLPALVKNSPQFELEELLKAELHDATPEEKAQWARDVKQLDPAQAKIALQLRREMLDRKAALIKTNGPELSESNASVDVRQTSESPFAEMPAELETHDQSVASTPTFGHSLGQSSSPGQSARQQVPVLTVSDRRTSAAGPSLPALDVPGVATEPRATPLLPPTNPQLNPSTAARIPNEANPFEPSPGVISNEVPPEQRSGIRNRFSKWGARFGFGNDEQQQQPPQAQTSAVVIPPVSETPTLNPQPLDRRPVANLQTLILRRENELREWGVVPPNNDARRQDFIRQHVELRMLYLMNGQQSRALDAIPGISASEQEFWQQVLWGLSDYFDLEGKSNRTERISQTVKQFETAVNRLKEEARLSVRNVNFCRKISSYGNYERFRRDDFTAGQPVLVYSEVENFKSVPVADGRYRTLLKSRIEIFRGDVRGRLVDSVDFKPTEDLCRNARRDYFHSYELTIPQEIGLGPHVLRLTIEDQLTGKQTTQTVNFNVK